MNIERVDDKTFHLSQPHLIDQILKELRLDTDNVAIKDTPASPTNLIKSHKESKAFDGHFHMRSIIGKLNYLEKCTQPDIA